MLRFNIKLYLIIATTSVIVLVLLMVLFRNGKKEGSVNIVPSVAPQVSYFPTRPFNIDSTTAPNQTKVWGVPVNDFRPLATKINEQGDLMLSDNPRYKITFLEQEDKFVINIKDSSFADARKLAEDELLNILGINQEYACRLTVSMVNNAGLSYPFSFCFD